MNEDPSRKNLSATRKILIVSAITIGLAAILTPFVLRIFLIGIYRIPQNGMYPGLPANSRFYSLKHPYHGTSDVKRGDIIIFVHEQDGRRYNVVWRVIGLPGDTIVTSGENLIINGQGVKRQRTREADGKAIFQEQIGNASYEIAFESSPKKLPPDVSITVPPDKFFVMGDNRFDAYDSRSIGSVPFDSIVGKKLGR
jgi:signal peptidase I